MFPFVALLGIALIALVGIDPLSTLKRPERVAAVLKKVAMVKVDEVSFLVAFLGESFLVACLGEFLGDNRRKHVIAHFGSL